MTETGLTAKRNYSVDSIIWLLCFEELLLVMGMGMISPIMPKFVLSLGVGPGQIGLAVGAAMTAFGIARAGMDIPAGRIARCYGRRLLLVGAPALVTVSVLGCALATDYWQLIIWRLIQGGASAFFSIAALIVIAEISSPGNRGFYMSFFWGTYLIGASLGPGFGGLIGEYYGYRAVFYCYSVLAATATLWSYLRVPETGSKSRNFTSVAHISGAAGPESRPGGLLRADFVLITLVSFLTILSIGGVQNTLVPILGYERMLLSESQVGIGLTVIAIIQLVLTPLSGKLSDHLGRKALIVPGGLITALGIAMFAQSHSYLIFCLSALALGAGRGLAGPVPTAYVADIAQQGKYESTLSVYRAVSDLGWVLGPVICGYLFDTAGIDLPFYLTGAVLCLGVAAFGLAAKETVSRKGLGRGV